MRRITEVKAGRGYTLHVKFDDGVAGTVDLSHLAGKGVFALWRDRAAFEAVRIGSSGELTWGGEADLCPDSLYLRVTGKNVTELFPGARPETTHA